LTIHDVAGIEPLIVLNRTTVCGITCQMFVKCGIAVCSCCCHLSLALQCLQKFVCPIPIPDMSYNVFGGTSNFAQLELVSDWLVTKLCFVGRVAKHLQICELSVK